MPGLSRAGIERLHDRLAMHVERRDVPGLAALVARGDAVHVEVLGTPALNNPAPLRRDSIFRIASLTKPIAAAGAMALVDDGVIALADPVEAYLPELADRRVLRSLESPLDDTVPAERSITVEDLLTFRLGFGSIMAPPRTYPIQIAEEELGLMTLGPPWPPPPLTSDEWIARFATLPLLHQPGAGWRYNTGAQVLGVLLERASGLPLEEFLRSRLFEPLGMADTAFSVPAEKQSRFTTAYMPDESGGLSLLDPPTGGWWNQPPAMANAAGMLVSTLDDYWSFVSMLRAGGRHDGGQVLSPASVAAMTRNHLTDEQRAGATLFLGEHGGWGYGMATPGPIAGEPLAQGHPAIPWGFGWNGGTGTLWWSDPARGLTGILFTQRGLTSPVPPPLFTDFQDAAYAAIEL
jgi:CubicO group peptidase (beta-lactamase class C family)